MNYNIISTGSKGNAIVLNKIILLDCGVPFRELKDVYKDLKIVLLTHAHGDHFNGAIAQQGEHRFCKAGVCRFESVWFHHLPIQPDQLEM